MRGRICRWITSRETIVREGIVALLERGGVGYIYEGTGRKGKLRKETDPAGCLCSFPLPRSITISIRSEIRLRLRAAGKESQCASAHDREPVLDDHRDRSTLATNIASSRTGSLGGAGVLGCKDSTGRMGVEQVVGLVLVLVELDGRGG